MTEKRHGLLERHVRLPQPRGPYLDQVSAVTLPVSNTIDQLTQPERGAVGLGHAGPLRPRVGPAAGALAQ